MVAPTAMFHSTPLECTFCSGRNCYHTKGSQFGKNTEPDPQYSIWWVKKYCTFSNDDINAFTLFFPYNILMSALLLVMIERGFDRLEL